MRAGGSLKEGELRVDDRLCPCPHGTQGRRAEQVCRQLARLGSICPETTSQVPPVRARLRSSCAVVSSSRASSLGTALLASLLGHGVGQGPLLKHGSYLEGL